MNQPFEKPDAELETTLQQFGEAYRQWGAQQMRPAQIKLTDADVLRRSGLIWLRAAFATALALAVVLIPVDRYHQRQIEQARAQVAAQDEALLLEIHSEVRQSVPSSFASLADLTNTSSGAAQ